MMGSLVKEDLAVRFDMLEDPGMARHKKYPVTYGEDASRKRKDHAPRNYSLIRKFSLNILRSFKGKLSVPLAHIKAGASPEFIETLLVGSGFKALQSV